MSWYGFPTPPTPTELANKDRLWAERAQRAADQSAAQTGDPQAAQRAQQFQAVADGLKRDAFDREKQGMFSFLIGGLSTGGDEHGRHLAFQKLLAEPTACKVGELERFYPTPKYELPWADFADRLADTFEDGPQKDSLRQAAEELRQVAQDDPTGAPSQFDDPAKAASFNQRMQDAMGRIQDQLED